MYVAPRLKSTETLRRENVIDSKDSPIRLLASDRHDYVVKVQRYATSKGVVKEWLCGHFLKLWDLPVPDFAVIDIQKQHVPIGFHREYQPFHFDRPAFGSKAVPGVQEVTLFDSFPQSRSKELRADLLGIALFDIWTSNIDRHDGHYNMLYATSGRARYIPIDHEMCLDFLDWGNAPSLQTENESVIDSLLFRTYVNARARRRMERSPAGRTQFVNHIARCREYLPQVIQQMPLEWQGAIPDLIDQLASTIFTEDWLNTVWETYLSFLNNPDQ